jgi:hypothetical protein
MSPLRSCTRVTDTCPAVPPRTPPDPKLSPCRVPAMVAAGPKVLRLVGLSRAVIRVLRMTGVLGLSDVPDNVEDALAGVDVLRVARSSPP